MEDGLNYLDEKERQNTIDEVVSQVGLSHPITFDGYDVREHVIPYKTREVKASLLRRPRNMIE